MSVNYEEMIAFLKQEHNINGWNALDLNAGELIRSAGEDESSVWKCVEGMKKNMLEGDVFTAGNADSYSADTTVRYYCDNLRPERRRLY